MLAWPPADVISPKRRRGRVVAVLTAVVLVLGCGGAVVGLARLGAGTSKASIAFPATTPSPTLQPLRLSAYRTLLGEIDAVMAPAMQAVIAARNPIALEEAATSLYTAAQASYTRLSAVAVPKAATSAHEAFVAAFARWRTVVDNTVIAASGLRVCTGPATVPAISDSPAAAAMRTAIQDLAAVDATSPLTVGGWLPAVTAEQARRLANGTFVKKGTRTGSGQLKIDNSGTADVSVSLAPAGSKTTAFTVYLRAGGKVTVKGVKDGTYDMYLASGTDWDPAVAGFSRDCGYTRSADTLKFTTTSRQYTVWSLTLKPSTPGNARMEEVNPAEFPQ